MVCGALPSRGLSRALRLHGLHTFWHPEVHTASAVSSPSVRRQSPLNDTDSPFARPDIILEHPTGLVCKSLRNHRLPVRQSQHCLCTPRCAAHTGNRAWSRPDCHSARGSTQRKKRSFHPTVPPGYLGVPTHPTFEAGMSRTRNVANDRNIVCKILLTYYKTYS